MKVPRKSSSDKKEYEALCLENGVKVLFVKQQNEICSKLAAVAMCVGSGCFNDPKDVQGMSHFLEHMIFMGSEKYPKENEFDQFVSSHGGFDNAYTECEHTLFHFDIIEDFLDGALDRFSQLFVSPIMSIESMEREMEAVESEFQMNHSDDDVRITQIFCQMIDDEHPASNFIWGNLKTLKEDIKTETLHQKLHDFRKKNFVADQMFLCIQSSQSIEQLKAAVIKYFSGIPRKLSQMEKTHPLNKLLKPCFYEKIFFVKSTTNKLKLLMTFPLPSISKDKKFLEYLASLIQSEGTGSLTDFFMNESLAVKVKSKVGNQSFEQNSFLTFFTIEVNLTSTGLKEFPRVLHAIFAFLLLINKTSIEEHKSRYEEFKEIKEALFKYRKEKPSIENVQELAVNMRYFKDEDVIVSNEICPEFDEKALKALIARMNERKFNLLILSGNHQKYDKFEKWFGTEYAEVDFPENLSSSLNEKFINNKLWLPKRNEFVCRNFEIVAERTSFKYPMKIFDSPTCECFYKLDGKFKLPHAFIYVLFSSPVTGSTIVNLNLTSILSMCVKNFLSEKLHSATVVGYSYRLNSVDNGLILKLSGFYEKLKRVLEIIVETIENLQDLVDKSVFDSFKKELRKNCRNCLNDGSLLNDDCRLGVTKKHHRMFYDRLKNASSLNFSMFKKFCQIFQQSINVKILVQGNLSEEMAIGMAQMLVKSLKIDKNEKHSKETLSENLQLPIGTSCLQIKSLRADYNSVIKNYYQLGKSSVRLESMTELVVNIINEPLFDSLRSQAQLGYGISCSMRKNCGVVGILITVEYQENKNSAEFIDQKIEAFLKSFENILNKMSDENFLAAKSSIMLLKLNADTDLEKEVDQHWEEIKTGENVFNRNDLEATEIENITKPEVLVFYREAFLSSKTTRKLSVRVTGSANSSMSLEDFQIEDVVRLKEKLIPIV